MPGSSLTSMRSSPKSLTSPAIWEATFPARRATACAGQPSDAEGGGADERLSDYVAGYLGVPVHAIDVRDRDLDDARTQVAKRGE